jgi:hypothetical protein
MATNPDRPSRQAGGQQHARLTARRGDPRGAGRQRKRGNGRAGEWEGAYTARGEGGRRAYPLERGAGE